MKQNGDSRKTIAIFSSAFFYQEVLEIEKALKKLGFRVKVPETATKMKRKGDFDVSKVRTWLTNPDDYKIKLKLMKNHFKKVIESDATLVINNKKNGIDGYIGGNVLMEMLVAFLNKKPIFIYQPISYDLGIAEEIYGLMPIFIDKDLELISKKLK